MKFWAAYPKPNLRKNALLSIKPRNSRPFAVFSGTYKIKELWHEGLYRPVGVYIIFNEKGEVLATKSAKAPVWSYPQGGIEVNENLVENLLRELNEELGIASYELSDFNTGFYTGKIDFQKERQGDRGFSLGKAYIFSSVKLQSERMLNPNSQEISAVEWLATRSALRKFQEHNSNHKFNLLLGATSALVNIKCP